jgi:endonuclease/exonuclease/phosphatase (EEP) superfamily protein YafD
MMTIFVLMSCALVLTVTLLPLSRSHLWWVRGWEFPRVQILLVAFLVCVIAVIVGGPVGLTVAVLMAACAAYQLYRIAPYLPWVSKDLDLGDAREDDLRLMALNVEMENRRFHDVIDVIRREAPDVLFLMETDEAWIEALEPLLEDYDTVLRVPQDDYYGLLFATRLKPRRLGVERLTRDDTPSVFALLEDREGRPFHFVGLHPKPPVPGEDTAERDLQTLYAARFAREKDAPVLVMGDFNDAAWSESARLFKHTGEYLDVRVGRGLYSSFHSRYWWFRCPIDQLFLTEGAVVSRFEMGPDVGSDHFPVIAHVRLDKEEARRLIRRRVTLADDERALLDRDVDAFRAELERIHGGEAEADGTGKM